MPSEVKLYQIFLASPRDVAGEREIVREEIYRWNSLNAVDTKIVLLPVGWETDATPDLQERGQAVINRQIVDPCDLLIGIFWTCLGTPTPEAESGTVEEIERFVSEGKRCIIYFSDKPIPPSKIDQQQYSRLENYRQELNKKGLTGFFKDLDELRQKVFDHITTSVQELSRIERERLAAEREARATEQAVGLQFQPTQKINPEISFTTLRDTQASIKQLLESKFGFQDIEDLKESGIANIQTVLNSSELATLLTVKPTAETVSAISQVLETATSSSMYIISSICKYGDDNSPDWLELVGDWVERLGTREIQSGYEWTNYIKTYPGLLLLYASGVSALRSAKTNFLKQITERSVYSRRIGEFNLIEKLEPRYVFYDNLGTLIEPGFNNRFTPVSDHLTQVIKDKLYPFEEETKYTDWFDFFEFLLSFKSVQVGNQYPYFGSFIWRKDGERMLRRYMQDAALGQSRYGKAIQTLFNGRERLIKTAEQYDRKAKEERFPFGRASVPAYIKSLVE